MNLITYMAIILVVWNILTLSLYGIDKSKAKKGKWRISEFALISCAFLMGAAGAVLGMWIFRHKTKHTKFNVLVPLALILNIGIIVFLWYGGVFSLT